MSEELKLKVVETLPKDTGGGYPANKYRRTNLFMAYETTDFGIIFSPIIV